MICQKLWPVSKKLQTDTHNHTHKPSDEHTCQNWKFWQQIIANPQKCTDKNTHSENKEKLVSHQGLEIAMNVSSWFSDLANVFVSESSQHHDDHTLE